MTVRGTLALAAIFAVLASYLALTREPSGTHEEDTAVALLTAPPESVSRVELGRDVAVVRRGSDWSIPQVGDLLAALRTLRPLAVVDDAPSDPDVYGLGADASRLRVLDGTRVLLDLEIGAPNPAGTGLYVRRFGQPPVLLVGSVLRWELEKLRRVGSAIAQP